VSELSCFRKLSHATGFRPVAMLDANASFAFETRLPKASPMFPVSAARVKLAFKDCCFELAPKQLIGQRKERKTTRAFLIFVSHS
jgi:hypothetical protein